MESFQWPEKSNDGWLDSRPRDGAASGLDGAPSRVHVVPIQPPSIKFKLTIFFDVCVCVCVCVCVLFLWRPLPFSIGPGGFPELPTDVVRPTQPRPGPRPRHPFPRWIGIYRRFIQVFQLELC